MDPKDVALERRKKRAQLLRYVRKMRGEEVEEDAALAAMSVEERDRAETIAKREVEIATEKAEEQREENKEEKQQEPSKEATSEAVKPAEDDAHVSDAEKLGKALAARQVEATRQIEKPDAEGKPPGDADETRTKPE
jgi:hypothetical protein